MPSPASDLLLGIDLGTTALKCALYDLGGNLVGEKNVEYSVLTPHPKWVEMDVETYWLALREALHALWNQSGIDHARVISAGISAQGETLVPIDCDGLPLRKAIVWLDNRAEAEAAELQATFGDEVYRRTGQPTMMATWPAAKLLWLSRHEPNTAARAAKYLLIEDWLLWRLTGEFVTEGSLVTSTCYWDPSTKQWWPEMLAAIAISADQLPTVVEPGTLVGRIRTAAANDLGLPESLRVCTGALDQACGAIGGGNVVPGHFSENTGAAVALCATVPKMTFDPAGAMPCHYHGLPDTYMMHTFTSGGIVLRWFRDQFCETQLDAAANGGQDCYDILGELATRTAPGADGLLMLPHLQGAMAPENNGAANGAFLGVTLKHERGHFVRAIMESVAFIVRRNIDAIEPLGTRIERVRALGGGSRSPVWKQIEADILGRPVVTMKHSDAGALGAAILGGLGIGIWSDASEAIENVVEEKRVYEPNLGLKALYDDRFETYKQAYAALLPIYGRLG
jgi:sugar (pentulose or hexulose) kinase